MKRHYYISAYACSPSFKQWHANNEADYFALLSTHPKVIGIEHPFFNANDKYPLPWLKQNIPVHWNMILTSLPAVMQANASQPDFGIASIDEDGRLAMVNLIQKMNQYVHKLNDIFGRQIVKAVHLHTAPRNDSQHTRGNAMQLAKSLDEIYQLDWQHAALNLEHCDTSSGQEAPEKGYLRLSDEMHAVHPLMNTGIVINWGRSAIETRSINGPVEHAKMALSANKLSGFFFSGCSNDRHSEYGCWKDSHIPPQPIIPSYYLKKESLLGASEIKQIISLLSTEDKNIYWGIKVFDPSMDTNVVKKAAINLDTLNAIEYAANHS